MLLRSKTLAPGLLALFFASHARAQQPPPQGYPPPQASPPPQVAPQPYQPLPPPQGYPPPQQQPYPPQQQPYPPQQQPYPPQQQPYPPQQQPYPPQQQPYPQQQQQPYPPQQSYPQQQPYPQQQLPPPGYPQQQPPPGYQVPPPGYAQPPPPAPPVPNGKRDDGEMLLLYSTGVVWGLGSGLWIDWAAGVSDPGIAFIAPLLLGAATPIGLFLWDNYENLDRGVPASIATGLTLGAVEGIAIAGTQWQGTCNGNCGTWNDATKAGLTWSISTAGGIGGYFFGEYLKPDPRSLTFIASGAGWGAVSGLLLGAGAESPQWVNGTATSAGPPATISPADSFGNGASVGGLIGYNAGIVATGVMSLAGYVPSWRTQQAMWLGYLLGTAGASLVYLFYIGQPDVHHGMIANGLGGLAGVGIAGAVTANLKDTAKAWTPPFQIGLAPTPYGGAAVSAYGSW